MLRLTDDLIENKTIYKTHFFDFKNLFKKLREWDVSVLPEKKYEYYYLDEMLKSYDERLNDLYKEYKDEIIKKIKKYNNELFEKSVLILDNNTGFNFIVNVDKICEIIAAKHIQPQTVKIVDLENSIKNTDINLKKIKLLPDSYKKSNKKKLPVVVNSPALFGYNQLFAIDGNHRIFKSYISGSDTIQCYVIDDYILQEGFVSQFYIELLNIYHNFIVVINYCTGTINRYELISGMRPIINENY